jgi:hypothetical protein
VLVATVVALAGAAVALVVDPGGHGADLVALGAALVVGELFAVPLSAGAVLPLSYAVIPTLARVGAPGSFAATLLVALLVAQLSEWSTGGAGPGRVAARIARVAAGFAAFGADRLAGDLLSGSQERQQLLAQLGAAVVVLVVVDAVTRRVQAGATVGWRSVPLTAWYAVAASAVLMGLAWRGVEDQGSLGAWALPLFAVPLAALHVAFRRLATSQRTLEQTIVALAGIPEIASLTPSGRARRVAALSVALARRVGVPSAQLPLLERAALLVDLGVVTMDDPPPTRAGSPPAVAAATVRLLEGTESLAPVMALLRQAGPGGGGTEPDQVTRPLARVLAVARAFDALTQGDPALAADAVERLRADAVDGYDPVVVSALDDEVRSFAPVGRAG